MDRGLNNLSIYCSYGYLPMLYLKIVFIRVSRDVFFRSYSKINTIHQLTDFQSLPATDFQSLVPGEVAPNKSNNVFFLSEHDLLQRFVKAWHETAKGLHMGRLERVRRRQEVEDAWHSVAQRRGLGLGGW